MTRYRERKNTTRKHNNTKQNNAGNRSNPVTVSRPPASITLKTTSWYGGSLPRKKCASTTFTIGRKWLTPATVATQSAGPWWSQCRRLPMINPSTLACRLPAPRNPPHRNPPQRNPAPLMTTHSSARAWARLKVWAHLSLSVCLGPWWFKELMGWWSVIWWVWVLVTERTLCYDERGWMDLYSPSLLFKFFVVDHLHLVKSKT